MDRAGWSRAGCAVWVMESAKIDGVRSGEAERWVEERNESGVVGVSRGAVDAGSRGEPKALRRGDVVVR